jgi:hypothetical protein
MEYLFPKMKIFEQRRPAIAGAESSGRLKLAYPAAWSAGARRHQQSDAFHLLYLGESAHQPF